MIDTTIIIVGICMFLIICIAVWFYIKAKKFDTDIQTIKDFRVDPEFNNKFKRIEEVVVNHNYALEKLTVFLRQQYSMQQNITVTTEPVKVVESNILEDLLDKELSNPQETVTPKPQETPFPVIDIVDVKKS